MIKYILLINVIICAQIIDCQLNLQTCDQFATCSPNTCINVTNEACNSSPSTINVASSLSVIPCNSSCTQSSSSLCASSNLAKIFQKGIGYGIKAVYCTDSFLVVHSDGTPNHPNTLNLIPRPPGGGSGPYSTSCVTRNSQTQFYSFKIPLNPVALPTASASVNNVDAFIGNMLAEVALPKAGPSAVSITGAPIYPAFNDQSQLTWTSCEVDACNAHVGKGYDYHYHGDPFSNTAGKCMYSPSDYQSTTSHPPLIGFGLDGFYLYGRYLNESAEGYSTPLDDCGGHSHGTYGYHYHSQVLTVKSTKNSNGLVVNQIYTAYIAGPYKCWKGDISQINQFWDPIQLQANYISNRMSPSTISQRTDYPYLKQCCKSTNNLQTAGVSLLN